MNARLRSFSLVMALLAVTLSVGCRRETPASQSEPDSSPKIEPTIITESSAPPALSSPAPAAPVHNAPPASPPPAASTAVRWEGALDSALQLAATDRRPVMALCCSNRVPDCGRMRAEAMNDPEVIAASQAFHCTVADLDKDADLADRLEVTALPAIVFLTPDGEVYDAYQGYGSPALVAEALREASAAFATSGGGTAGPAASQGE